jgi:hypothetical protein
MKTKLFVLSFGILASLSLAQSVDHLSPDEIQAAVSASPGTGAIYIMDAGFTTPSRCQAQMPGLFIYTPTGWLNALSYGARKQYLPFEPKPEDTERALTIISRGCASGSPAGPICESITRVALLSDLKGKVVLEAIDSHLVSQSWQNGFGATAVCSSLVSRFSMPDIQKVQNNRGEFLVATFGGSQLLKMYTVKEKHVRKLGM